MPGVVLVVSDSLRADHLGCYGATDVATPHLDRFAEGATVFDRNYAASYPTVPNRLDLWTGRSNFLYRGWVPLDEDDVTLPSVLADAGVVSKLVFDTPMLPMGARSFVGEFDYAERVRGHHPDNVVSDPAIAPSLPADRHKLKHVGKTEQYLRNRAEWRVEADYIAPRTFSRAIEWLERNRDREDFFLMIDAWDPHEPFDAPDHYLERYADLDDDVQDVIYPVYGHPAYLTPAEHNRVRARYAATVSMVDTCVGRLTDALSRLGLADETLVIFTSDHGHLFGEHGLQGKPTGILGRLYEESIRTPLLIRDPDGGPDRVDAITQPPDLTATIFDAFDQPVPASVQGRSLAPLLAGDAPDWREYAVTGRFPAGYETGGTTAHTFDGWAGPERVVQPVTVTGDRWSLICHPDPGESELYDLDADPKQERDVIDDHADVAAELRQVYLDFAAERGARSAMVDPYRPESDAYERESIADGASVYAFEADGRRFAHLTREIAEERLPADRAPGDVVATEFGALREGDPDALVYLNQQYYRAAELAER